MGGKNSMLTDDNGQQLNCKIYLRLQFFATFKGKYENLKKIYRLKQINEDINCTEITLPH